jgi:LacI family transcriptional regulator
MKHTLRLVTIIDIAKKFGISASTVSRALSDHPDIKSETKELVRKVAKELRYFPNPIAQSLKSNRTTTIGIIVPEIKHDFFSSAISGIEEVAYQSGYTIILCQSNESYEREVLHTNMLMHHRVAVVVSLFTKKRAKEELVGFVKGLTQENHDQHIPFVKRPEFYAIISLIVFIILNIWFW